jgi:flagellar capping protein FliD
MDYEDRQWVENKFDYVKDELVGLTYRNEELEREVAALTERLAALEGRLEQQSAETKKQFNTLESCLLRLSQYVDHLDTQ